MIRDPAGRLLRTGLLTAIVDGIFASSLAAFVYGTGVARLWQGVASTLLGPSALQGGTRTALVGVAMHVGVAFGWSAVFLLLAMRSAALRRVISSPGGVLAVAAIYGPCIWLVMSLVVIPTLTGRPPTFTYRWWVQLLGHIPAVAIPIVWSVARGVTADERVAPDADAPNISSATM
jgi:hypothetical protein